MTDEELISALLREFCDDFWREFGKEYQLTNFQWMRLRILTSGDLGQINFQQTFSEIILKPTA